MSVPPPTSAAQADAGRDTATSRDTAGLYAAAGVVGQPDAVAALVAAGLAPVHAYLLVGPPGSGRMAAARAFAAQLLCDLAPGRGCGACRSCRLALAEKHPDLVVARRSRPTLPIGEKGKPNYEGSARWIVEETPKAPKEGDRKVIVIPDFESVHPDAVPALLKTIEEPPAPVVFVLTAAKLNREFDTITSRCVTVPFGPVPVTDLEAALVAEGLDAGRAAEIAVLADGRLDRARDLAGDEGFLARRALWHELPGRLDGTGHAVARAVEELRASLDGVADSLLAARHEREREAVEERVASLGESRTRLKELDDQHRQERRRVRLDELQFGLATLAARYRDALASAAAGPAARSALGALDAIQDVADALERNPNETLLLQRLLLRLPWLGTD